MAWVESHLKGGGGVMLDTILEDGQVSTTSAYATANFNDVSDYDFLFVKAYYDYNGVLKEYTVAVDVSQILVYTPLDFIVRTNEIGNLTLRFTTTSVQGYGYGGAWRDIYVDIKGTNLEVW